MSNVHDIIIRATPDGSEAEVSLARYMGDRFSSYRDACASCGARFNGTKKCNVLPVSQVPELLARLKAEGFAVAADPALVAVLQARADEARSLADAGADRLAAADSRLAEQGLALYPYQRSGVKWLAPRRAALLADDMGLGKTAQALLALPDGAAANVVCPAAVLLSWAAEARKWRSDLAVSLVRSSDAWRWANPGEIVLSTYGVIPKPDDALPAPAGVVLVADEAHLLKGAKTARSKSWRALRDNVKASDGRVWLLTGTPLLNRPPELWAVLGAAGLCEEAFGSWRKFCALFNGRKGQFGMVWESGVSDEAPAALQRVSLRRHKSEVLPDLPAKRHETKLVNGLPAGAVKACDAVVEKLAEYGIDLAKFDLSSIPGPVFELMSQARAQLAAAKIPAALEIVESFEEAGEPLVVVSAHRQPVDMIGAREGWAAITGETSPEDRGAIAAAFQAGELRGVAITYKAGGVGITLTRASNMLLVDLDWTPALIQQAEDRICRIGQKRGVLITRLVATHALDERVSELLGEKQALIDASVEASSVEADHVHHDVAAQLAGAAELAAASLVEVGVSAEAIAQAEAAAAPRVFAPADIEVGCVEPRGAFRAPANEVEVHAGRAILVLAGLDPDRAAVANGVGFSAHDGDFGHSLASNLRSYGRLSDKQWSAAVKLAQRYRRQVGTVEAPGPEREPEPRAAASEVEAHAGRALLKLAAGEVGEGGFSRLDAPLGRQLADKFRVAGQLDERGWSDALAIVRKHRRQVGEAAGAEARGPASAVELHASQALLTLAGLDADRASIRNNEGFSQSDVVVGHSLAETFREYGKLDPEQWARAAQLARKYRRQVGEPPAGPEGEGPGPNGGPSGGPGEGSGGPVAASALVGGAMVVGAGDSRLGAELVPFVEAELPLSAVGEWYRARSASEAVRLAGFYDQGLLQRRACGRAVGNFEYRAAPDPTPEQYDARMRDFTRSIAARVRRRREPAMIVCGVGPVAMSDDDFEGYCDGLEARRRER